MIKAVLLDLFGTVVAYGDVAKGTRLAWEAVYAVVQSLGASVAYERFVAVWERQIVAPLSPEEDVVETPFLGKILRFFESYDLPPDLEAAERAAHDCLAEWDTQIALPSDTIPTLQVLRKDYALALVSNFDHPPYVRELLTRYGLMDLFDQVTISGDIHIDKPDPRIFQETLDALGCLPQEAIFVGDDLDADVAGARAVGCCSILIDRQGKYTQYTDRSVRSLAELLPFLDSLRE